MAGVPLDQHPPGSLTEGTEQMLVRCCNLYEDGVVHEGRAAFGQCSSWGGYLDRQAVCLARRCLPSDNLESLFSEELKRRGLDSLDDVGGWSPADEGACAAAGATAVAGATCGMCCMMVPTHGAAGRQLAPLTRQEVLDAATLLGFGF